MNRPTRGPLLRPVDRALLFEDKFGDGHPTGGCDVDAWHGGALAFYLACCYGGDPPSLTTSGSTATQQDGLPATATALHREGVTQIVAYFGPVYDRQSTSAETVFYAEMAKGRRTRDAVRAARLAMAQPFRLADRDAARDTESLLSRDGVTPFAWAQLGLYHRGPDYPLSVPVPPKYAQTVTAPPMRQEDLVTHAGRSRILSKGFIGRRHELHTMRRSVQEGNLIHVVQGLGGLCKPHFAGGTQALPAFGLRRA